MNTISGSNLLSYYQDLYTSNNSSSVSSLEENLNTTDYSKAEADELLEVCKDFEAYFVEQVVKQMEKMIPKDEESSTSSKYLDYFGDTMVQEIADNISESNGGQGLGLAQMLYEQMKRNYGIEE